MANETFELSILLSLKDIASKGLLSYTDVLSKLESQGKKTLKVIADIEKGLSKSSSSSKTFSSILKDLDKTQKEAKQTISVIKSLQDTVAKGFQTKGKSLSDSVKFDKSSANDEIDKLTGKRERNDKRPNLVDRLANLNDKFFEPSRQIKDVWKQEYDSLKKYTDETRKLYLAQAKFKLINLSPEENKKAFDAVSKSVRDVGITTRAEGIEILTDLHNALGNLDHAIESLPIASKYRFGFETLFGDKFSSSQLEEQIQNGFKFLELTGKVAKGREEMEKAFNVMTQISASTGGRITPAHFLAMGKTGGTAVQNLTPEGMRNISTVMSEMGADRTGTSLMSMYQALVGGVMKQSAAERFDYFGLVDRKKIEYGKGQKIKRLMPGANRLGDVMMENPLSAADMLRDAMKAKGINTNDAKEVNKELAVLFQNRNAQRLMSILMNQRSQVLKEADLAKNAKDVEGTFKLASEDDLGKIKQFEKALIEFKTEAGIPLIEVGTKISQNLLPLLKFFGEHPTITQFALATIFASKGLRAISETASILKTSGITSFFSRATSSTSIFTQEVGSASNRVAGFTRPLDIATQKTNGLRGAWQSLTSSPMVKLGVTFGSLLLAEAAINRLLQIDAKLTEREQNTAENLLRLKALYDGFGNQTSAKNNSEQPRFDEAARLFIETIKENGTLRNALHPQKMGFLDWIDISMEKPYGTSTGDVYNKGYTLFNPKVAAHRWSGETSRPLENPNILASVITQIRSGIPDKDSAGKDLLTTKLNESDITLILEAIKQNTSPENWASANQILQNQNPLQSFSKASDIGLSSRFFKEKTPQLTDPNAMAFFRTQNLPQLGFSAEVNKQIESMLRTAFPESFAESSQLLTQNQNQLATETSNLIQNFVGLNEQLNTQKQNGQTIQDFSQTLINTQQPITETQGKISDLGTTAERTKGSLYSIINSTNGVATSLNTLSNSISSWKPPSSQPQYTFGFPPPNQRSNNGSPFDPMDVKGYATGGTVKGKGLAYIHAGEDIMPADVTSEYRKPQVLKEILSLKSFAKKSGVSELGSFRDFKNVKEVRNDKPYSSSETLKSYSEVRGNLDNYKSGKEKPSNINHITVNAPFNVRIDGASPSALKDFEKALDKHAEQLEDIIAYRLNRRLTQA